MKAAYLLDFRPPPASLYYHSYTTLHFPAVTSTVKTTANSTTTTSSSVFFSSPTPYLPKTFINRRFRCISDTTDSLSYSNSDDSYSDGIVVNVTETGKRSRRIVSSIGINAGLETVWDILTDYERLADFIPGLALSRLLHKQGTCARLLQIGQQDLALGLKFNAKAVLDCNEKDLEVCSDGRSRDIEFKMVEGDFEIFEGKWSIKEHHAERCEGSQVLDLLESQEMQTTLSYVLEVKPKLWLPVRMVEGRVCKDIKTNLSCVRDEAHLRLATSS